MLQRRLDELKLPRKEFVPVDMKLDSIDSDVCGIGSSSAGVDLDNT